MSEYAKCAYCDASIKDGFHWYDSSLGPWGRGKMGCNPDDVRLKQTKLLIEIVDKLNGIKKELRYIADG